MPRFRSRIDRAAIDLRPGLPRPPGGLACILTDEDDERHQAWFDSLAPQEREALRTSGTILAVDFRPPNSPHPCPSET